MGAVVAVRVGARLELQKLGPQAPRVDDEGAVGRGAFGEGAGEDVVVGGRRGGGGGRGVGGGGATRGWSAAAVRGMVWLGGCCCLGMVGVGGRGRGYVAVEAEEESFAMEGRRRFGHVLLVRYTIFLGRQ